MGWGRTPETLYDLGVGIIMDYLQVFDETGRPDRSWYEVFGQGKKYKFITQPKIESLEKGEHGLTVSSKGICILKQESHEKRVVLMLKN